MADVDDAEARREARRRRILENAQTRLEKITGRKEENIENVETSPYAPEPEEMLPLLRDSTFPEIFNNMNGNAIPVEQFSSVLRGRAPQKQRNQSSSTTDISGEPDNHFQDKKPLIKSQSQEHLPKPPPVLSSKILIVIIAVVVRLSHTMELTHLFADMIFLPLILIEFYKMWFVDVDPGSMGMLGAGLLLCGVSQKVTNILFKCITILRGLVLDYSLFLFTFILTHIVVEGIQDGFQEFISRYKA